MESIQPSRKRRLSSSACSPKKAVPLKRRSNDQSANSATVNTVEESVHRDSGIVTIFIPDDSDDEEFISTEQQKSFLETEEVLRDSPISKSSNKSQMDASCSSKGAQFSRGQERKILGELTMDTESYVQGSVVAFFPGKRRINARDESFRVRPRLADNLENRESTLFALYCDMDRETWVGYQRDEFLFDFHPQINPDHRSVLLEWMMEVCKARCLLRKTYHMSVDYVDRFLSFTENLPKQILQLLGIAALSLAAKIEEIFPPKLSDMAYVTDTTYTETDIKAMERLILSVLGASLMPVTVSEYIAEFLHEAGLTGASPPSLSKDNTDLVKANTLPLVQYSRICRLVDLSMLDSESLGFTYKQLAASALFLSEGGEEIISNLYNKGTIDSDLSTCIWWMKPYADTENRLGRIHIAPPPRLLDIQLPHLQGHDFHIEFFNKALEQKRYYRYIDEVEGSQDDHDLNVTLENEVPPPATNTKTPIRPMSPMKLPSTAFITPPDSNSKRRQGC